MREAPRRVLVVEDMVQWRDLITRTLKRFFPDAVCAGADTWEEIAAFRASGEPDLMTMDGNLTEGGGEGPRFVRKLRTLGVQCPIIMISANEHNVDDGMRAGANAGCDKGAIGDGVLRDALRQLGFLE